MERVRISELRKAIEITRERTADPVERGTLDMMLKSIRVCIPKYIRITKMYEEVMKIRNNNQQPDTRLEIMQNFQEKTVAGF